MSAEVSRDGTVIALSQPGDEKIRIIKESNGGMQQSAILFCLDQYATYCGSTIAMDENATVLAAYAANSSSGVPAVFVFDLTDTSTFLYPSQTLYLTANNASTPSDNFGWNRGTGSTGLVVSADADYIVVGKDVFLFFFS